MYNAPFVPIKAGPGSVRLEKRRRFIVLQPGARLHYAVPALLARAGMLERLYTDVHAPTSRLARWLLATPLPSPATRWLSRTLPPELYGMVSSSPIAAMAERITGALGLPRWLIHAPNTEWRLAERVVREAFRSASALYVLSNAHLPLVREAKRRGLYVVHEQIAHPYVGRIVREERLRFPGFEPLTPVEEIEIGVERDKAQWHLADLVLAPSTFVRDAIVENRVPGGKIAVVPYGVPEEWLSLEPTTVEGRLLFVGNVGLLKGVHYLASASRELQRRRVRHEVRIVGAYRSNARSSELFAGTSLIGPVPRSRVRDEFRAADIFVFPTLAEGCALVHLESLACGVPVITTPNCGSIVRDGVDGYIVPIRDPIALADAIQRLLENRALRNQMATNARERAREFTWARFGERLLKTLGAGSDKGHP